MYLPCIKKKINYGICRTNQNNDLKSIEEKPDLNFLINTGFYVMNKKILKKIPKNKYFDTTDLIKKCIKFDVHNKEYKFVIFLSFCKYLQLMGQN